MSLITGDLLLCDSSSHPGLYYHVAVYYYGQIIEFNSDPNKSPGDTLSSLIEAKKSAQIRVYDNIKDFLNTGYTVYEIQRYPREYVADDELIRKRVLYYLANKPKYNIVDNNCEIVAKQIVLKDTELVKKIEGYAYDQASLYLIKFHSSRHTKKYAPKAYLGYVYSYRDGVVGGIIGNYIEFLSQRNLYKYGLEETLRISKLRRDTKLEFEDGGIDEDDTMRTSGTTITMGSTETTGMSGTIKMKCSKTPTGMSCERL